MAEFVRPFPDFFAACRGVISCLKKITPFQTWVVTRIEDDRLLCLHVDDDVFGIKPGDEFIAEGTFCANVISGKLPRFVGDLSQVSDRELVRPPFGIEAHVSLPLVLNESSVFGTICASSVSPVPELKPAEIAAIELAASMLSTVLALELRFLDQRTNYERVKMEAESDELTSLLNRRGWDRALLEEEALCSQFGLTASLVVIDLDHLKKVNDSQGHRAGDQVIRRAAEVIEQTSRSGDVVARTGGDEFAILTKGISPQDLRSFARRIRIALMVAGVSASVGTSTRGLHKTLTDAWTEADAAMYESKRSKT